MTSNKRYVLNNNNLFSIIFDIKPNQNENSLLNLMTTPVTPVTPTTSTTSNSSNVTATSADIYLAINQENKNQQILNPLTTDSFDIRNKSDTTNGLLYTVANANAAYKQYTGADLEPALGFTLWGGGKDVTLLKGTNGVNEEKVATYVYTVSPDDKLIPASATSATPPTVNLEVKVTALKNFKNWEGINDNKIKQNKDKIKKFLDNFPYPVRQPNIFRRLIRTLAAAIRREVGTYNARYKGDKALQQIEYGIICWSIVNSCLKKAFKSEGDMFYLFSDKTAYLNESSKKNEGDKDFFASGYDQKTAKSLDMKIFQENEEKEKSVFKNKFEDNDFNYEVFVMAFFDGLIMEELPDYTSWAHLSVRNKFSRFNLPNDKNKITNLTVGSNLDIPNLRTSHGDSYIILEEKNRAINNVNVIFTKN